MSFLIDIQPVSNFQRVRITNQTNNASIDLISKGGILNSWWQENEQWDIIDGNHFENGWEQYESNGFKSAKMIPFACRLSNGQYHFLDQQFTIEKFYLGKHALHGILYDALYEIIKTEIQSHQAQVIFEYNYKGSDKGYPFSFQTQIVWTFYLNNKIVVQTNIWNQSECPIPMMDGWHPYFKLGENINHCKLQFKNNGKLVYDPDLLPTGQMESNTLFDTSTCIGAIHLDNGFLLDPENPKCTFENENYTLIVEANAAYPYLQLYTPDHRKSIAIENLSAAPDCFNNKIGLQIMQPQSIWNLETSYHLIKK